MRLIQATLEQDVRSGGAAVTLYFLGEPLPEEVKQEFSKNRPQLPLSCDTSDPDYEAIVEPNALSEYSGLIRIQGFPTA